MEIARLKDVFLYCPDTGNLTWKQRPRVHFADQGSFTRWNARYPSLSAGGVCSKHGYIVVSVFGKSLRVHRVAFAIYHGRWPEHEIDHINGDRADNRINNLRDVTKSENLKNQKVRVTSKSGHIGVFWGSKENKWRATITVNYVKHRLGYFDKIEDAIAARAEAQRRLGFHENHGRAA